MEKSRKTEIVDAINESGSPAAMIILLRNSAVEFGEAERNTLQHSRFAQMPQTKVYCGDA